MAQLPERICVWYQKNKRDLPWRRERDPYKIWVSEIMLQQTRVEAVKPYFERFVRELPDIAALAACPEDKLLKLWEGLGYYSRVRNMQKAARMIVGEPSGVERVENFPVDKQNIPVVAHTLPEDPKALRALPGIGSYTAGAIASIAYGVKVPAVDGNVMRILARVTADDRDVLKTAVRREAEQLLEEALRACETPGDFNQGMMDLGAGVCLPNAQPLCGECPLADICAAHREGKETAYPVRGKAKERRVEQRTILLIRDGERVALTRRQDQGLLAGMYEFPNLAGKQSRRAVLRAVEERKLEPLYIEELEPAKHLFSHIEWQMTGYEIRVAGFPEDSLRAGKDVENDAGLSTGKNENSNAGKEAGRWFLADIRQIEREYPIPSAYRVYTGRLQIQQGTRTP